MLPLLWPAICVANFTRRRVRRTSPKSADPNWSAAQRARAANANWPSMACTSLRSIHNHATSLPSGTTGRSQPVASIHYPTRDVGNSKGLSRRRRCKARGASSVCRGDQPRGLRTAREVLLKDDEVSQVHVAVAVQVGVGARRAGGGRRVVGPAEAELKDN